MRLLDLDPRWFVLEDGGPKVGLTFDCPHCRETRLGVAFHHAMHAADEDGYILARHGSTDAGHIWTLSGPDDFASLSLSPSVDASSTGHWHGFVTNGEVT
ncbi:MAG TPA: DUF6527 family protein [Caulobacteraceae bacterium]|nr:DUF6527 family protein [Caulobacteraceae bacterium]